MTSGGLFTLVLKTWETWQKQIFEYALRGGVMGDIRLAIHEHTSNWHEAHMVAAPEIQVFQQMRQAQLFTNCAHVTELKKAKGFGNN